MVQSAKLTIVPGNMEVTLPVGTPLKDILHDYGVEFPCGARGICRGCRVKVVHGEWKPNETERSLFTGHEIEEGFRIACMGVIKSDVTLHIEQWQPHILTDHASFNFIPQDGYGIAVDIGTTTIAAQLLDRQTGTIVATQSCINPQVRHGSDLISRIHFAVYENGMHVLTELIRDTVFALVKKLMHEIPSHSKINRIVLTGNTVMHHLFCGINPAPLSKYPYESQDIGLIRMKVDEIGWDTSQVDEIIFLPCIGSFIGSDLLAGILVTGMYQSDQWVALVDLGTNGEIIVGNRDRIIAASTAAGPAFEAGNISIGMRAENGAIYKVSSRDDQIICETIGNIPARGICGSGLVDAVAVGLANDMIHGSGKIQLPGKKMPLCGGLHLEQKDIRQLQLAKAAIAVGMEILIEEIGISDEEVQTVYLAGAFGNYISIESAQRIGMLNFTGDKILPAGNTALRGTKMALNIDETWMQDILKKTKHVSLSTSGEFQERYITHMHFPQ